MTIQIAPLAALLLVVSIAVGITVFKHTARAAGRGDGGDRFGCGRGDGPGAAARPWVRAVPADPTTSTTPLGPATPVE
ncbi:hypothetical protein ACFVZW_19320 [Streptomyces sp. NPDC059567]|uniref:hypothetical protein n=1 Tax=Streptomyces sp. NPDC059567 TaxID=3346867 RepID=UPI00367E40FA